MKIVKNIAEYSDAMGLTMSLGMFDGVHKGHQEIIKKLKKHSETHQLESALLTFWPHPRKVLQPEVEIKLLNTLEEKLQLLERFGIQKTFLQEFNDEFRNLSGEDFVKQILLDKLHMKHIVIGYDHHFGKNKSGNFELLEKMASENNFVVEETKAVLVNELAVSSTKIRNALSEGDIITANEFLGYHYPVSGTVVAGKKIGRTIGYPTANIDVDSIKLLPKNGAYIVDVELNGQMHKGMLSIGTNPTVNGTKKTTEVYILDFDQDIYGENITVYFRDYLHDEIKFESLEKLIERLDEDKQLTIDFFK
ncbi:bifunctional riboflavin kinase/FAD synthetase [Elizabethkingia sp. HX WHF]|uniref:bifunctional riboflavin kinase/FAD synthetase n=1 Tax=Elizabethkingia TaxID=308865 RepID=UPI00099A0808|nr:MULTISPECIES: bifunctional riboflavin kinase/FAD synthetase [Elizabethkingia]ATL43164.1 bifunctional riboflavin kinase/FAD synthetase [Elizabethkingia miricola]MCL1638781.1 bifunctional riboflavin kinase/FAD synthetase [Elizabethkingia bruuniana]MDX8565389.1 bifunctional riboflavin kinase/FAD synthetase [Elizabethkingia sp. HX WHF]OPC26006.1 riboflavin biosynthesis protein RibF [Elizabethkingia bruuniana]